MNSIRLVILGNRIHDRRLLFFCQLWVNRQGQDLLAGRLCVGEVPALIPEIAEGRLQVERFWVVDLGRDTHAKQVLPDFIATQQPYDKLVIDMPQRLGLRRKNYLSIEVPSSKRGAITISVFASAFGPGFEVV